MTKERADIVSPAQLLRGRLSCFRFKKHQGARNKQISRFDFATRSDGFVGAELQVRPFQSDARPRTVGMKRTRKRVTDFGRLSLVSGSLATPLLAER
jgi:hypothetical protein